jgi:hypothetical protein
MESEIGKSGLFRYRIEWKSAISLRLLFLSSNFDTGSLSIKLAYQDKWVISIQVPYIERSDLYRSKIVSRLVAEIKITHSCLLNFDIDISLFTKSDFFRCSKFALMLQGD